MVGAPNRDRQAERREATRLEILDAAWQVAREAGLGALTLRAVAERVGMRAPSLYSHFASKMDIYDAMFGQAWSVCLQRLEVRGAELTAAHARGELSEREVLSRGMRAYFDFSVEDPVRQQLMDLRTIPGFEPSAAAYQPAVDVLELSRRLLVGIGVTDEQDHDLLRALVGGLVNAQLANDPGGDRWGRLLGRAIDMYADAVRIPPAKQEGRRARRPVKGRGT